MKLWLCETTGNPVPFHDCLACAERRQQPVCPFPPAILKALANSMQADERLREAQALARSMGIPLLRVTGLLGCTRQAWYGLHYPAPLETPSAHWARLRGTIFHAALEALAGEEAVAETRLIASLEGLGVRVWIAGKVDHYDPDTGLITDYKTINSFGKKLTALDLPKLQHVAQLQLYGWLLDRAGYPYPTAGRIVYMDMGAVRTVDVPMPDEEARRQVEADLVAKVQRIVTAPADGPAGDPQEAWQCAYCVYADLCPYRVNGNGK